MKDCKCRVCLVENHDPKDDWVFGEFRIPSYGMFMIVCQICGNKRCPHATDHTYKCTNSNEPGQPGSVYHRG